MIRETIAKMNTQAFQDDVLLPVYLGSLAARNKSTLSAAVVITCDPSCNTDSVCGACFANRSAAEAASMVASDFPAMKRRGMVNLSG